MLKTGIENNSLSLVNQSKPEILKDLEEADRVKNLFNGDEEKALEYVLAKKQAEASGAVDGIVETITGTVDAITNFDETVVNLYNAITNPDKVYEAVKVSVNEWTELYDYALKNDPTLAGEMMGYMKGKAAGEAATGYVMAGAAAKVVQKVAQLKKLSKITDQIVDYNRLGSGLKPDPSHRAASFLSKEQLLKGKVFEIIGNDGVKHSLLQTEGFFNGKSGIYEYI